MVNRWLDAMQRRFHRTPIAIVIVLAAFIGAYRAVETVTDSIADFKWFSGLGFPDVAGCPYVRVAAGWHQTGSGSRETDYINGFLLGTNGQACRVLTLGLWEETLTNSMVETNEYEQVSYSKLDLKIEARSVLQFLQNPPTNRYDRARSDIRPTDRTETFVLAWACWRHGLNEEAADLYRQAKKLPDWLHQNETPKSFRESLEENVAYLMMWRAVVSFGNTSITRPQLLVMFEPIVTNYPDSEYHERAVQTVKILRRMIAEDEAHAKNPITNLDQLPVEARISELIFRLRNQNGHQYSQPGSCDIFGDWRREDTNTPAHQLLRLGYSAVPQLIAALGDDTFTRSVGFQRDFVFSHHVLTVGDCAEAILERIAGRTFFVPTSTSSYMSKDQKVSETGKAAEAWWAEFQAKGEKWTLIEEIASGGKDSPAEAEILCQRYPDVAVPTLMKAIRATTEDWIRPQLVQKLGEMKGPEAFEFLRTEMTNSPDLQSRVAAAYEVRRLDSQAAIAAMMKEWLKVDPSEKDAESGESQLIDFLASSDSADAIQGLAQDIRKRKVDTRLWIVDAAETQLLPGMMNSSPATRAALECFLVKELEDTDRRFGMSGTRYGKDFNCPRVCDMAGQVLADRITNRYVFDLSASLKVRDHQRIQCMNVWRQMHDLAPLPFPAERARVPVAQAATVTEIDWHAGSAKPSDEFARQVEAFKGKPLDASQVIALLTSFVSTPEPHAPEFQFNAIKDEDLTGVRLTIRLVPGVTPMKPNKCDVSESGMLGDTSLLGSFGGGDRDGYTKAKDWSNLADAINEALRGRPETPFEIGVQIKVSGSE